MGDITVDARSDAERAQAAAHQLTVRVSDLEAELDQQAAAQDDLAAAASALGRRLTSTEAAITENPGTAEVIARVQPSVFTIETEAGSGSAFVIASTGGVSKLITNAHVVNDVFRAGGRGVRLLAGERTLTGSIVSVNNQYDLAVIAVAGHLPALEVADGRAAAGDAVFVIGSPLGFEGTVSTGVASTYRVEEGVEYLQFSAAVNPGNSGGPVVDADGDVVGVATMKIVGFEIEGISFAVPADRVCSTFSVC